VAKQLLEGVRDQDIVCRYGGEEFALILPGTNGDQAMVVAEALRHAIEQGKGGAAGSITISVGVASPDGDDLSDVGELFRAADAALYEAKAAGRNRVVRHRVKLAEPAAA
jgi:diguanylate cyclase (GGDEF)-like protein